MRCKREKEPQIINTFITDSTTSDGETCETKANNKCPNISIGKTITATSGQDALVYNSGTDKNPVLNFVIPKGDSKEKIANLIFAYSNLNKINAGLPIVFEQNLLTYGDKISHEENSPSFYVLENGLYEINYCITTKTKQQVPISINLYLTANDKKVDESSTNLYLSTAKTSFPITKTVPLYLTKNTKIEFILENSNTEFSNASLYIKNIDCE